MAGGVGKLQDGIAQWTASFVALQAEVQQGQTRMILYEIGRDRKLYEDVKNRCLTKRQYRKNVILIKQLRLRRRSLEKALRDRKPPTPLIRRFMVKSRSFPPEGRWPFRLHNRRGIRSRVGRFKPIHVDTEPIRKPMLAAFDKYLIEPMGAEGVGTAKELQKFRRFMWPKMVENYKEKVRASIMRKRRAFR